VTTTEADADDALSPERWAREVGLESPERAEQYFARWVLDVAQGLAGQGGEPPPYYSKGAEAFRKWRTERVRDLGVGDHLRQLREGVPSADAPAASSDMVVDIVECLRQQGELLRELVMSVSVSDPKQDYLRRMLARLEAKVAQLRRALLPPL